MDGISLLDPSNPKSIPSLVPPVVAERILSLVHNQNMAKYVGLAEYELWTELRRVHKSPTPTDALVRYNFWNEYNRAIKDLPPRINITEVYGTVISREMFYKKFITDPFRLVWMITPPQSYENLLNEVMEYSIRQLREILEVPLDPGTPNYVMRANQRVGAARLVGELTGQISQDFRIRKKRDQATEKVEQKAEVMKELDLESRRRGIEAKKRALLERDKK